MSKQNKKQFMHTSCSPDDLSLQFSIFMNNLSSYFGLVNAKIRASGIDLPVPKKMIFLIWNTCDFMTSCDSVLFSWSNVKNLKFREALFFLDILHFEIKETTFEFGYFSGVFFANHIDIFHKPFVLMVILRC